MLLRGTETAVESKNRHDSSNSMIPVQRRSQARSLKMSKAKFRQRVTGLMTGCLFIPLAIQVMIQMFQSDSGIERLLHTYTLDESLAMRQWIGNATIRESPLVKIGFQGKSEPINGTLYLQAPEISSFQPCSNLNMRQQEIYSDQWQRLLYSEAIVNTRYNFTFLNDIELIAPVVNCDSALIHTNDSTRGKFYFLTRNVSNPQDLQLLTLAMAVQEYWIPSETQTGSAAVASFVLVSDLQSDHVDHHFITSLGYPFYKFDFVACDLLDNGKSDLFFHLQTVPRDPKNELSKRLTSSYRSGFHLSAKRGHYNIRQQIWLLEDSPLNVISSWKWKSKNTSRNTWSWTHIFDLVFVLYVIGHVFEQVLIIHQAYRDGILWCADGSVAISKPFFLRGALVVLFWYLTCFWDITEFCVRDAHEIAGVNQIFSFTESFRMDVVNIMFAYTSYLARLTKERVDNGLVFVTSMSVFYLRINITNLFPAVVESIKDLLSKEIEKELRSSSIGPMQLRTPQTISHYPKKLIVRVLAPLFLVFPVIAIYIILRKLNRSFHPPKTVVQQSSSTSNTSGADNTVTFKSTYTNFELATGSQLELMYGVLGDFDNYIFIKGMRFASADGVYGAGFVIVNKKYLVNFNDVWYILLMKLIRVRFSKVYIFSLEGTTVKKTALLAFPHTMTLRELLCLSCTTLS